ncbi:hypothetical protein OESDEN_02364 [Oesophagostomum dentatum]|uniref:Globin domain-containing protein n=1 Tax=Oesophagostomum dentatum TaxID=61180 RepID=A0A0B1TJG7_OESDE|nr:hypothetical protein OESDEN_02364 [Oesophagostomum dentatum]
MLTPSEVRQQTRSSLKLCAVGTGPTDTQNGKDFYKYMFSTYPDLRVYFKGAENFSAEDVQKSERLVRKL